MSSTSYLQEIIYNLSANDVKFIICGGVALVLQGSERMTMDLDLSVDLSEENLIKFLDSMKKLNLTPRVPVPPESILSPEKREIMIKEKNALVFTFIDTKNPYKQVDMFITDNLSYEKLKNKVEIIKMGDYNIEVLSKEALLELKKSIDPPRDKDIFDIKTLEKLINKVEDGNSD
jgi:hypothetical protein